VEGTGEGLPRLPLGKRGDRDMDNKVSLSVRLKDLLGPVTRVKKKKKKKGAHRRRGGVAHPFTPAHSANLLREPG